MKDTLLGVATSVVLHLSLLLLSFSIFAGEYNKPKVMAIDFALVGDEQQPIIAAPKREKEPNKKPDKLVPLTQSITETAMPEPPQAGIASDPQGDTVVQGVAAIVGGETEIKDSNEDTGQGTLLPGGRDYNYIRDEVMKHIKYPLRARKMGFEGKVVISFIVLENGMTSNITVVKSSGYQLLDQNATEGIAKTMISKKVPYRIEVFIPILYRLQPSGGVG